VVDAIACAVGVLQVMPVEEVVTVGKETLDVTFTVLVEEQVVAVFVIVTDYVPGAFTLAVGVVAPETTPGPLQE
jgi:hypothetical protein